MSPQKLLIAVTLAIVVRDLIKFFILDKIREFELLRGSIAAAITVHKEFIFPSNTNRNSSRSIEDSRRALIEIAGEIDRFASLKGPLLFLAPKSEDLRDASYCFLTMSRQEGNNGILMKKVEQVFKLGPFQINPHNSTNHKNTQMDQKK
ncbi:MAG: hypothetical protein AB8G05_15625 [Oligoflexales bacterium]